MRNDTLRAWGSRYVRLVLERSGRNKRKACRALGISYHTLQAYLRYAHRLQVSSAQEIAPNTRPRASWTHPAQLDRRKRGTAVAVRGHAHVRFVPRRAERRAADHRADGATVAEVGMSRTTRVMAFLFAMGWSPHSPRGRETARRAERRGNYQEHDRATNTSFTATTDAAGNAVLTLHGGDFTLEKVIAHTGDATLRLSQGKDVVTIAISQGGFQVARGQKALRVDPRCRLAGQGGQRPVNPVGSQAVRSFKRLVSALEQRDETEDDGPLALSAMVDGAIVQLLDGDPDASRRLAKRITRKQRAALRVVKAGRLPGVMVDCIGLYQVALMSAYGQFESCAIESTDYSWWSRDLVFQLCSWEWAIRSQQYIWQFIGCFMFPW